MESRALNESLNITHNFEDTSGHYNLPGPVLNSSQILLSHFSLSTGPLTPGAEEAEEDLV